MSAPIGIVADVGNACHCFQAAGLHKREELLPHRSEVDQMVGGTEIFLCNLEFHHHLRLLHRGEQRTVWLAWLEVHGTVLDLNDHIISKLPVERHELQAGLVGTVGTLGGIDEGTPHHNALVGLQDTSQHIGSVGVGAPEILRARLTLGVGLHEETTEVGNQFVDFIHLILPPFHDLCIERVGCFQSTHLDGRCKINR